MRIILEGCDGVGKTTLAKILADKYKLDICHCTQYDPTNYEFYRNIIKKENVIWDRHTIGELIYPEVFHRKANINIEDARLILNYAKELDTKIFVLTDEINNIASRLYARGNEDERILNKLEWINEKFVFYANLFHVPVINTSEMTLKEIFNLVETKSLYNFIHK